MRGLGDTQARRHLLGFLAVATASLAVLGPLSFRVPSTEHEVGPFTEMLEPGDWIHIPMRADWEYYDVSWRLRMRSNEPLDVFVRHGVSDFHDFRHLQISYQDAYASSVLSSGVWREEIVLPCDCGASMIIDNTAVGEVNQTQEPVVVEYSLHWMESKDLTITDWAYGFIALVIAMPIGASLLYIRVVNEERRARLPLVERKT